MTSAEEKYARAIRTSHLKMGRKEEEPRDAERVWAAGAAQTRHLDETHKEANERSLGVLLARLRLEWDSESSAYKAMQRNAAVARATRARELKDSKAKEIEFDLAQFDAQVERSLFTERALILVGLRCLKPAKQAMLSFALAKAGDKGCGSQALKLAQAEAWWAQGVLERDLTPEERINAIEDHAIAVRAVAVAAGEHHALISAVVGKAMDAWLDRLCYQCSGRGFNGGFGSRMQLCHSPKQGGCGGTGIKAPPEFSKTRAIQFFGMWLLNVMESKVSGALGRMANKARNQ